MEGVVEGFEGVAKNPEKGAGLVEMRGLAVGEDFRHARGELCGVPHEQVRLAVGLVQVKLLAGAVERFELCSHFCRRGSAVLVLILL